MRKRLLAASAAVLLLVALAAVVWSLWPVPPPPAVSPPDPSPVTWAAFGRIAVGMKQSDVEALLGGGPGNYCRTSRPGHGGSRP